MELSAASPARAAARDVAEPSLRYAWHVAFVLMVCNTFSFVDRQILGLLVPPIKAELGLSDTQIGLLQVLTLNLLGLILGPALPGLMNDYIYRDPQMVGWSLAWTVGGASLASALLFAATFRPYRHDYAAMHGGTC